MVPWLEKPDPVRRTFSTSGQVSVNAGAEHDEPSCELLQWPPDVATTRRGRSHGLFVCQREGHRNAWHPSAAPTSPTTSSPVVCGAGIRGQLQGPGGATV